MTNQGTIYWIGAGPGDVGLITVKGLALLQQADAIVGDALGHARLLQQARTDAEIHDVGCRAASNKMPQAEVQRLLVELGQKHKTVVRLYPGDPFVYGKAAPEMVAARAAGLRVEVVPGVSAAIAAPAYAGVPLTDWDCAASFAVVSGVHSKDPAVRPNWTALAQMETLVILMPLRNLAAIVEKLGGAGMAANTPALVVQNGTRPQQKQLRATLGTLVQSVQKADIQPPAIVVLGRVVGLSDQLDWFRPENFPLLGQRVLVTRPIHQAGDFMAELRNLGAEPVPFPTIEIQPAEETARLDEAIRQICRYTAQHARGANVPPGEPPFHWLVLTSTNGVTAFFERLAALQLDSRCLASVQIAAIGPATAAAMHRFSITPDLIPQEYTAEGVLAAFDALGPVTGQRFLLARADIARKTLAIGLRERGAQVDEIPAYRTVPVSGGSPPPPAEIVTFTSSSTVQGFVNCLGGRSPAEALAGSRVVCIGPITAATAQELGVPVSAVAKKYTIDGILNVLKGEEQ
ncbi:MAG: uroporphyrinogen-III C-methyltransferase [Chloroflexi bacterium]|nr:MAG: uroporphyrinogen-III C-methyltransferase [Chloroflexota bacterium]